MNSDRLRPLVLLPLLWLLSHSTALSQDRPVALILGNWKYLHLTPLMTPEADVAAMKKVLESQNPPFDVTVVENGTTAAMEAAIKDFAEKHAGNPVVLVYASGHGLQVGGVNYLTGIDTDLGGFEGQVEALRKVFPSEDALQAQVTAAQRDYAQAHLLSVDTLIGTLGTMSPNETGDEHVKMVFLDACREPFPEVNEGAGALFATKSVFGGKSAGGLARVTERPGVFVGMSAAANQVAQQSDSGRLTVKEELLPEIGSLGIEPFLWQHYEKGGRASDLIAGDLPPSFFTERLVEQIAKGGSLEEVFNRAGASVRKDSLALKEQGLLRVEQTPAKYSLYYGAFRFMPGSTEQPMDWEIFKVAGREYISDENITKCYQFERFTKQGAYRIFKHPSLVMTWEGGKQEIYINNIKFHLAYPIISQGEMALLSTVDLVKLVEPIVRPSYIRKPIAFDTIVIDPGHGGSDVGELGLLGKENDYTLATALRLERELQSRGFKTVLTRRNDVFLSESDRASMANRETNSIFISLHFGAGKENESGIETFALAPQGTTTTDGGEPPNTLLPGNVRDAENIALAAAVHAHLISELKPTDRGVKRTRSDTLNNLTQPAIHLVGGFLTNPAEAKQINDPEYRQRIAASIADAVVRFETAAGMK